MNTANAPNLEVSKKLPQPMQSELSGSKFTAEQIETDCPDQLRLLGSEISARIEKAEKQLEQAENHSISIDKLIAQARELCDGAGFNAFQKRFFPNLGKSRVYELLAIGNNKKSVEEIRANTRARVAKYRSKKAEAPDSVTVTENSEPEPDAQGAPKEHGEEASSIASEQTPETAKPRRPVTPGDEAMRAFTVQVMELDRRTNNRRPERFSATAVPVEVLARLGKLLADVANLKKSDAVETTPALPSRGNVSVGQPAGAADRVA